MKPDEDRIPILVNNPYGNVLMNVEPLFRLIYYYSLEDAFERADTSIKYMALSEIPEWLPNDERQSVILFLYKVRSIFSAMKECQISNYRKGDKP